MVWSGKAIKKEQAGPGRKAEIKRPKVRTWKVLAGGVQNQDHTGRSV